MRSSWLKIVELAVAGALTSGLLSWALRRRNVAGERGFGATLLRYPPAWRVLAWSLLLIPLAGIGALAVARPPTPEDVPYFAGMVALFGVLGGALLVEVLGVAHELKPAGLERVTPWRGRRFLPWSRVTRLRFSESAQCWRIVTSDGDGTWISQYVSGLGPFARAALEHVRPEVVDREPGTRARLLQLAGELAAESAAAR